MECVWSTINKLKIKKNYKYFTQIDREKKYFDAVQVKENLARALGRKVSTRLLKTLSCKSTEINRKWIRIEKQKIFSQSKENRLVAQTPFW